MKLFQLLFLFSIFTSCTPKIKTLYIGTNAEFPPFEYLENGEITGFDIEIIEALTKEMNIPISIQNLSWEGLLPALQGKKIDMIIAGMTKTPDREKIVSFSDSYYTSKEQMIIVLSNNNSITNIDSLISKKVGVVLGFTGDVIASSLNNTSVQRFNTAFQAIQNLQNQKIDAVLLDYEPAQNFAKTTRSLKLINGNDTIEEYSIAVRKQDAELLSNLNIALKKIHENGTYTKIYNKYFDN